MKKSCPFGLLCVFFMKIYQFVCLLLSRLVFRVGCELSELVPDDCLSFYFVKKGEQTVSFKYW